MFSLLTRLVLYAMSCLVLMILSLTRILPILILALLLADMVTGKVYPRTTERMRVGY